MLPDAVEYVVGGLALLFIGLGLLSRRMPHVAWLRAFDIGRNLTPEQAAAMKRRSEVYAGVQLILLAMVAPLAYVALTVMFFNTPERGEMLVVGAGSLVLFGLGVAAIAASRRQ